MNLKVFFSQKKQKVFMIESCATSLWWVAIWILMKIMSFAFKSNVRFGMSDKFYHFYLSVRRHGRFTKLCQCQLQRDILKKHSLFSNIVIAGFKQNKNIFMNKQLVLRQSDNVTTLRRDQIFLYLMCLQRRWVASDVIKHSDPKSSALRKVEPP